MQESDASAKTEIRAKNRGFTAHKESAFALHAHDSGHETVTPLSRASS